MTEHDATSVRERQDPLRAHYEVAPGDAAVTDRARTTGGTDTGPFHGTVIPGEDSFGVEWPFGAHRAVGGYHDAPNPGDVLCAALAVCLDSSIRMIASPWRRASKGRERRPDGGTQQV